MEPVWPGPNDVLLTSLRWVSGLGFGAMIGLLIAFGEKPHRLQEKRAGARTGFLLTTILDFLRAIPIIALVPVIQTIGINEFWKIGLIAWAVMFPVWIAVRQARLTRFVDAEIALIGRGLNTDQIFWSYRFPKALGGFLRGIDVSIGIAWISVVAAEWIGTYSPGFWAGGLGYKVVKAHEANNWSSMLLCLGFFGLMGTATAWLWRKFISNRQVVSGFNPMCGYRTQQ